MIDNRGKRIACENIHSCANFPKKCLRCGDNQHNMQRGFRAYPSRYKFKVRGDMVAKIGRAMKTKNEETDRLTKEYVERHPVKEE